MRKTIREKKVAVIRMLMDSMKKVLNEIDSDLDKYKGKDLNVFLDAHFEKLRCNSGNMNLVLEDNRVTLHIMYQMAEAKLKDGEDDHE